MGDATRAAAEVPGAIWLVAPAGSVPQFTGADFTDDDRLYAKTAEDFVRNEVLPRLEEIESKAAGVMPALLKRAGELGLLMVDIPEKYGGLGLRKSTSMLVSEHGALCASFSVSWGAHTGIGTLPLVYYGTEAQKLGIRGSSTRQVILEDARVGADKVLGQVGQGHKIAFNILNIGRFKLGAGSGGAAKDCLAVALQYAKEREQFRRPIASFGMIQRKLADMATRIYVADSMSYRTAGLMDAASERLDPAAADYTERLVRDSVEEYTIEASILKVFGTETLDFVADESLQILGGYGFTAEYPVERHYRDSRINRIFEGTNEINRLIIPATLVKRIGQGRLSYADFFQQVDREIADRASWPPAVKGPLERELRAAEVAKRVIAYTARVLIERDLASLKDKQQHLEILANMIIDCYAMDSVVNRTRLLLGHGTPEDDELRLAMTNVFVSSANERVIDGARRLLVNELEGEELRKHLALEAIVPHMPIRTIAVKTRIAEALVARGLGPVFLR